jgi:hypothetical protein
MTQIRQKEEIEIHSGHDNEARKSGARLSAVKLSCSMPSVFHLRSSAFICGLIRFSIFEMGST